MAKAKGLLDSGAITQSGSTLSSRTRSPNRRQKRESAGVDPLNSSLLPELGGRSEGQCSKPDRFCNLVLISNPLTRGSRPPCAVRVKRRNLPRLTA
jgi:hypothetical protein